jgi:hypothetical protein
MPEKFRIVFACKGEAVHRRGRHQKDDRSATAQSPMQ